MSALTQLDADTFVLGHADPETKAQVEANLKNAEAKRAKIAALVKEGKSTRRGQAGSRGNIKTRQCAAIPHLHRNDV